MKVQLIDEQRKDVAAFEVDNDKLAGTAILVYKGDFYLFSSIPSESSYSKALFMRVKPPTCFEPNIQHPAIAEADAAVQIGEEAFRAGFNACYEWQIDRRGAIATVTGNEQKRAEDRAWEAFEPSEATKELIV